jgi:hypothetical protein
MACSLRGSAYELFFENAHGFEEIPSTVEGKASVSAGYPKRSTYDSDDLLDSGRQQNGVGESVPS